MVGARVIGVKLRRRDFVERCAGRKGRITRCELLEGSTISELQRHGKNLAILTLQGPALGIHLGMSGHLRYVARGETLAENNHIHCEWNLKSARGKGRLVFRDPRRFGGIWTFASIADLKQRLWQDLGPDALSIDSDVLHARFARTERAIKAVLLDQHVLAGVGNIYADEALFSAGIHPLKPANRLTDVQTKSLTSAIQSVMNAALDSGGSTIRSYTDADGNAGRFAEIHRVYDQAGEPCPNCAKPLRNMRVSQRTTTYCPRCQPIR